MMCGLLAVQQVAANIVANNVRDVSMRAAQHKHVSQYLGSLSDEAILSLLKQGTSSQSGWASIIKLDIDGIPIFVKQIPLNAVEGSPQNIKSTKNVFGLPLFYQYGVGSGGFSIWRELLAHVMTTEWVLSGENQSFPLMYHWRVLKHFQEKEPIDEEKFNRYVKYWENSPAIAKRMQANHNASTHVVLFIEYLPETLASWLNRECKKGKGAMDQAIAMVERNLQETVCFLNKKEMLHFDAYFLNILTDGEHLYFSDFGLAMSTQFALSEEELQFFETHLNYDRYYVATELTNWIINELYGQDCFDEILQTYAEGTTPSMPTLLPDALTPYLAAFIKRYAPIALTMNHFFEALRTKTKQTPYPKDELDRLWDLL